MSWDNGEGAEQRREEENLAGWWKALAWPEGSLRGFVTSLLDDLLCDRSHNSLRPNTALDWATALNPCLLFIGDLLSKVNIVQALWGISRMKLDRNFEISSGCFLSGTLECGKPTSVLRTVIWIKTKLRILWTSNKASPTCCFHYTCDLLNPLGEWGIGKRLHLGDWTISKDCEVKSLLWSVVKLSTLWVGSQGSKWRALLFFPDKCVVFIILEASPSLCKLRTVL